MLKRTATLLGITLLFAMAGGCVTRAPLYLGGYRFAPEPSLSVVVHQGTPAVEMLVSVVGVRRGDRSNGIPSSVEVRIRLENKGSQAVTFDPHSASLVTGSLQNFDPAEARPPTPVQVTPNQTQMVTLYFAFPPGHDARTMPVDTLRLRWQVQIESQSFLQTAYFERTSPLYYEGE